MRYKIHAILVFFAALLVCCSKSDQPSGDLFDAKAYSKQPVGKSARDLLLAAPFTSLKIEIQYTPGYKPGEDVTSEVENFLKARLNKPGGISITETQIPSLGKNQVSSGEIMAVEDAHRTQYANHQAITLYVVIADADYTDHSVLGFAYRNTSLCLLGKTIYDNSGGIGQANRAQLITTVLEHEIGHLLGLVDIGSSMLVNHADHDHPDHCDNKNCLMYYAAETTDILGLLIAGNTPALDQNCLNDLKANGGK